MKIRKSFSVEEEVWNKFNHLCLIIGKPWDTTMNKSQLIESMIINWNRKNIKVIESNLKDNEK